MIRELETEAHRLSHLSSSATGNLVSIDRIFFGGGTPSIMQPEHAGLLLEHVESLFDLRPDAEITLESNPESALGRFDAFFQAGIRRFSIGVQSLNDPALRFLGRQHDRARAIASVEEAATSGAEISMDLMYARPGQTWTPWLLELQEALQLPIGHLSAYQLTFESGTRFFSDLSAGHVQEMPDDHQADLFMRTHSWLEDAGFPAYEVSNFSKENKACRHNLGYWDYQPWIGVGPGAHSRLMTKSPSDVIGNISKVAGDSTELRAEYPSDDGTIRENLRNSSNLRVFEEWRIRNPNKWLARVEGYATGSEHLHELNSMTCISEACLMGLRLKNGVSASNLRRFDERGLNLFDPETVSILTCAGYIEATDEQVRTTREGWLRLNAIIDFLLPIPSQPTERVIAETQRTKDKILDWKIGTHTLGGHMGR